MPPPSHPWPERPFSLISTTPYLDYVDLLPARQDAVRVARLMALTHNTIFRAFNAIYQQPESIHPLNAADVNSFIEFTICAIDFLENHHRCEELVFFPMLEAQAGIPGLMGDNVEQHRAFQGPLRALRGYLKLVRLGAFPFDVFEFRDIIDELAPVLERHLHDEIPSILEAGTHMSDEAMSACYKALHDEAEGTADAFKVGPFVMGCQDDTHLVDGRQIAFPELPFSLAPYLVEHVVARRHADVWRFCPSTFHGRPRKTEFLSGKFGATDCGSTVEEDVAGDRTELAVKGGSKKKSGGRIGLVRPWILPSIAVVFLLLVWLRLYLGILFPECSREGL
ncbi:hypothetical protein B0T14DRAFT_312022 [Immersiella caudata]|uniref:Hemerythrin-like domain-containing protein n=1 Tax=Immersiella caudata TaxID=314043 RepID=A0AA39WFW2_9PEZI|nr:hypothetical protein B0T14DRAFT_312022 [Immersiella caudata]